MQRLLDWHQRIGRLGLRLLCLHLLWVVWTLRGGIVLGLFPATSAVHGVLRDDARHAQQHPDDPPTLAGLRSRFAELWRAEFGSANRLGAVLSVIWAVLLIDRVLVTQLDLGDLGPALAGAHTVAGVVLAVLTVTVWPLQAHFDDGARGLLRRSLVLVAGRPAIGALTAAGAALVLYAYYLVPGLVPVFGVAAPAAIATACMWRTGVLAAPASAPAPASPLIPAH
ncbi:YesL family protein [Ruania alba]|uniref:Uncharacterized membrane protein YesL n=1 Tax=Ruania alba TaxID=648782 RepID=A0A1H5LSY1_9MICO|nr:DUF624 domain-containing protein [Ruania alba]SEE80225.1 Uncharacterized membrane protein YesL [Ruania alba]